MALQVFFMTEPIVGGIVRVKSQVKQAGQLCFHKDSVLYDSDPCTAVLEMLKKKQGMFSDRISSLYVKLLKRSQRLLRFFFAHWPMLSH